MLLLFAVDLEVRLGRMGALVLRTRESSSCIRAPRRGTGGVRIAGSSVGREVWLVSARWGRGGGWRGGGGLVESVVVVVGSGEGVVVGGWRSCR